MQQVPAAGRPGIELERIAVFSREVEAPVAVALRHRGAAEIERELQLRQFRQRERECAAPVGILEFDEAVRRFPAASGRDAALRRFAADEDGFAGETGPVGEADRFVGMDRIAVCFLRIRRAVERGVKHRLPDRRCGGLRLARQEFDVVEGRIAVECIEFDLPDRTEIDAAGTDQPPAGIELETAGVDIEFERCPPAAGEVDVSRQVRIGLRLAAEADQVRDVLSAAVQPQRVAVLSEEDDAPVKVAFPRRRRREFTYPEGEPERCGQFPVQLGGGHFAAAEEFECSVPDGRTGRDAEDGGIRRRIETGAEQRFGRRERDRCGEGEAERIKFHEITRGKRC